MGSGQSSNYVPSSNDITKSSFGLFNFMVVSRKFTTPVISDIAVYVCCIITGLMILFKIINELLISGFSNKSHNIMSVLLEQSLLSNNQIMRFIIILMIALLVFGLYIIQMFGLTVPISNKTLDVGKINEHVWWSVGVCIIGFGSLIGGIFTKSLTLIYIAVISLIIYYIIVIITVTTMNDPIKASATGVSSFCENAYIGNIGMPMVFIILGILIIMTMLMSLIGHFVSDPKDNCLKEFDSLIKCLGKHAYAENDPSAIRAKGVPDDYVAVAKMVVDLTAARGTYDTIQNRLNNMKTTTSQTCYKSVVSILILCIIVVLLGLNPVILACRPELFIAILVIQRMWLGSSYSEKTIEEVDIIPGTNPSVKDPGHNTQSGNKDNIRRKSWDIIGMPFVRWLMYISRIDTAAHRHNILFGETNRKVFSAMETPGFSGIKGKTKDLKDWFQSKRIDRVLTPDTDPTVVAKPPDQ